jgi:hypothetical protein
LQQDADALGLGVEVLGFTVGGMHPPVMVALDYQAVVSAELRNVVMAARGILDPLSGALAQSVAVLVVVANSARILRFGNPGMKPSESV